MNKDKIRSVKALNEVLERAVQDQRFMYAWVAVQCKSQGALAQTHKPNLGIKPMSLNTLKGYANEFLVGGFEQLDVLRKAVLCRAQSTTRPSGTEPDRMAEKISDLQNELRRVQEQKATLQKAYFELNQLALEALPNSPHHQILLKRHNKLYESYFGLRVVEENG